MFFKLPARKKGFTLIELMVVIAIISILSTIGFSIYSGAQMRARDAKRLSELKAIASALEVNKTEAGYVFVKPNQFSDGKLPGDVDPDTEVALDPKLYPYCIIHPSAPDPFPNIDDPDLITPWDLDIPAEGNVNTCPNGAGGLGYYPVFYISDVGDNDGVPFRDVGKLATRWRICTRLENNGTPKVECISSTQ